ncbi:MAG TPA: RtcB family protein [Myxococcales bacterium]|jgi:tRNA-splicing ligase RtcB
MNLTTSSFTEMASGVLTVPVREGVTLRLVADAGLLSELAGKRALEQLLEAAGCAGVEAYVVGLPNLEEADGFPSGCVVATGTRDAALIPAGAGPDINCGVRLLASKLHEEAVRPHLEALMDELVHQVHVGDDKSGPLNLSSHEVEQVLDEGCRWLVSVKKIGKPADLEVLEDAGAFLGAGAQHVPTKARQSAGKQLGTLGRGASHFVEVDVVDRLYDEEAAARMQLAEGRVVVQIHTSARDLGKQVWQRCLQDAQEAMVRLNLRAPRPQLAWAPLSSKEGEHCYLRLLAAENFGLSNRHVVAHQVRSAFQLALRGAADTSLPLVHDASGNTARLERFGTKQVCVHRRGAAPARGPGHPALSSVHRDLGEPVLLPGSMGTPSYVMIATGLADDVTWASAPHGAGRAMSRHQAQQRFHSPEVIARMAQRGVVLRYATERRLAEEEPGAYRDAGACAVLLQRAGIARPVAQLRPIGVLKG